MKKLCFSTLFIVFLLCGCTSLSPVDLYGFITVYNKTGENQLSVTDFKVYTVNGVNAYIYVFENGDMLTLREQKNGKEIASCSVISEKESESLVDSFFTVCKSFTGLSDSQCRKALDECKESTETVCGYTFSYVKNGYAVCYRVQSVRFCGEADGKKPDYSHSAQTDGQ